MVSSRELAEWWQFYALEAAERVAARSNGNGQGKPAVNTRGL